MENVTWTEVKIWSENLVGTRDFNTSQWLIESYCIFGYSEIDSESNK